jgi:hypothetical protein
MQAVSAIVGAANTGAVDCGAMTTQLPERFANTSPYAIEPRNSQQTEANALQSPQTAWAEEQVGDEEPSEPNRDSVGEHREAQEAGIGNEVAVPEAHADEHTGSPEDMPDESAFVQEGTQAQVGSLSVQDSKVSCARVDTAFGAYRLHSVKPG